MDTSYSLLPSSKLPGPRNPVRPKPPCAVARVPARVKNKSASAIQISAEQLLRDAREGREPEFRPAKRRITDLEELSEYRLRKRKEFEGLVRRNPREVSSSVWLKYARWEEAQCDMARARSVFERALDASLHRDHTMWLNYADFEMRNRSVNHARNVWDRAVSSLPRVDQLWNKYVHMEELLGAVANARQVFERWTAWRPSAAAWKSYAKFELRYGEVERARAVYERFAREMLLPDAFIHYAKFEMQHGEVSKARRVYEHALDVLDPVEENAAVLLLSFAKFEEKCGETDRARAIYRYGLDQLPKGRTEELFNNFVLFEKLYGDPGAIDYMLMCKRRLQYEDEVTMNPLDYDSWFDYIKLEESVGDMNRTRQVYERALANLPPAEEKRYWQRYIYIWIMRAMYEELDAHDVERTRDVYKDCLKLIPHRKFSFAKIWLLAAQFEIRRKNLKAARQILGNAIGMAPKGKIFKNYIEIEMQLGNIDRCRILYERYIEWSPESCYTWCKYAELEKGLRETGRARSIYELAIAQPALDTPEVLWKEYLQFEIDENELDRTRELYERLLDRTKHLKVWISYAEFEASAGLGNEKTECEEEGKNDIKHQDSLMEQVQRSRAVFERAFNYFSTSAPELQEEKAMLLKEWYKKEISFGNIGNVILVRSKAQRSVKRKRSSVTEGSSSSGSDEYIDDIFADEAARPALKILEAAYEWKKHRTSDPDTAN